MTKPRTGRRTRLIEGVTIAAAALLILKGSSLVLSAFEPDTAPDGLPAFAHVLSYARSNFTVPDPTTTGSVPAPHDPPKEEPKEHPAEAPKSAAPAAPPKEVPPISPSSKAIMERLGERREELQRRARDMDTREQLLEEAERRLENRASETKPKEGQPGAAPAVPDTQAIALKGLVTMYETMKPKEAARVFERLPQDVLVPVVRLINARKMAEIMAAMSPESAEKLTVALARPTKMAEDRPAAGGALPPGELPALEPAPRPRR